MTIENISRFQDQSPQNNAANLQPPDHLSKVHPTKPPGFAILKTGLSITTGNDLIERPNLDSRKSMNILFKKSSVPLFFFFLIP